MKNLSEILGKILKKNHLENKDEQKWDKHNEYVKMVKDIHFGSIPSEIRNTEMNFEFNTDFSDLRICSLDTKVKDFLNWYYDNWIKGEYTDIGEFYEQKDIINFIEKMASWYEMRYPNSDVNRLVLESNQDNIYGDDILLNKGLDSIQWKDLFDYNSFLQTLSEEEKWYLRDPKFAANYYMKDAYMGTLYISNDGIVRAKEVRFNVSEHSPNMILGKVLYVTEDFNNLNLLQVKSLMEKYNMLNDMAGIQEIIDEYQLQIEAKQRLLDCVMFRIIERGGEILGPCRAFLFAKEFNRNIDIPMMYGVKLSIYKSPNLMTAYLKAGGHEDLICLDNYFMRASEKETFSTITVFKLLHSQKNNSCIKYTLDENNLHQRLVDVLTNQINEKTLLDQHGPVLKKVR